jgi:simple sugar transport system permease protein
MYAGAGMKIRSKEINIPFNRYTQIFSGSASILIIPAAALLVLIILVFLLSDTPFKTLYFFFIGPFSNIYSFGNMLNSAVPLIFGALGLSILMKTGNLNLGGEGQVYLGGFCAVAVALAFPKFTVITIFLAVTAGVCAGGGMAAFSGYCKQKWNVNELITTFLLSCAVIPVVNFLVTGPFLDPETSLLSTKKISENLRLSFILQPSSLNTSILIAIAAVILVHFFLSRTKTGYEIRMTGSNELFARYGGINTKLNTVLAFALSGGFYGLAGSLAVMGTYHSVIKEFSGGLGWNGLAAALIANFSVPAVIPAALFIAWIGAGARIAMQNTGLTLEFAGIVQAVIFLLSTSIVIRNIFTGTQKEKNGNLHD